MTNIHILADNNTLIDRYYLGEPAVSYYIIDEETKILFDTGYSDVFLRNAELLGLDISEADAIVLSHGHNDHTAGLPKLLQRYPERCFRVVAHPECFRARRAEGLEVGSPLSADEVSKKCTLTLTQAPLALSKHLIFLGQIPRENSYECQAPVGRYLCGHDWKDDFLPDDTALVHHDEKGIFIITGCSHSGICNIIEYAIKVTGDSRVLGVLGGFHLMETGRQLDCTVEYFRKRKIPRLYPCHCVCFEAKARLHRETPIHEVGAGLTISL